MHLLMLIPVNTMFLLSLYSFRWMHSECAALGEISEAKDICLLCKEDQQHPAGQPCLEGMQLTEEMAIQAETNTVAEKPTEASDGTPGEIGASEMDTGKDGHQKETPMGSGMSGFD